MINNGFEVTIAASEISIKVLKNEFPDLKFFLLKGYRIQYSYKKRFLPFKILLQTPKILLTIRNENRWLQKLCETENFDLIISDNRFGFFHKKIPSVFITHQLMIYSKNARMRKWMQQINYKYINRFSYCWIPDFKEQPNLAGDLSHPTVKPAIPIVYLGPLSRFKKENTAGIQKKYQLCFLLSGPEPQRTLLENKIIEAAPSIPGKLLLLRAKPDAEILPVNLPNLDIINHLPSLQIKEKILQSEFVLSRTGYTTVMELAALGIPGILIPTPGQTEQEYLSNNLMQNGWFYCFRQEEDLLEHIKKAFSFEFKKIPYSCEFPQILHRFFSEIGYKFPE